MIGGRAQNVILLIGDGMGDSEITSARNYTYGAAGLVPRHRRAAADRPVHDLLPDQGGAPDYVPDSAATGSAWATGTKTYDNAISVDIRGKPQPTLLELAKAKGLKTGDVTTSEIQDATPAVQVAHISARSCYGPVATAKTCPEAAKENGGRGSITEQLLDTRPDVTLGGGAKTFGEKAIAGRYQGQTLLEQAEARGYQVVTTRPSCQRSRTANQTKPVLGLFAGGNLPVRWVGPKATPTGGSRTRCPLHPEPGPAREPAQARRR